MTTDTIIGIVVIAVSLVILFLIMINPAGTCDDGEEHDWEYRVDYFKCMRCGKIKNDETN